MSVAEAEPAVKETAALSPMLRVRTRVLPGGRVEVTSSHLREGDVVEFDIPLPAEHGAEAAAVVPTDVPPAADPDDPTDLMAWLDSLPPSSRTAEEWEQFERDFQQERAAWDR